MDAEGDLQVPAMLYGTAWKEDETERLTGLALSAGFAGIDTANQRKHYHEAGVGAALRTAFASGVDRDELFIQTKFTFRRGQDHRLPYDPDAPIAEAVAQSFASSLAHLGVDRLDSYVLHGPSKRLGLGPADREAWAAMERILEAGGTRWLGVSNVSREQLAMFCDQATHPPAFVQNRCYARLGWDAEVRAFCARHGIVYQGFSLLTANASVLRSRQLHTIADRHGATPAQVVFRFAIQLPMIALTGTTDPRHMAEDLAIDRFSLDEAEMAVVAALGR